MPFSVLALSLIPCLDLGGRPGQTFPLYTYSADGRHRSDNIKDSALELFRAHYADRQIAKEDIFHYIYAVLHHPAYRERFADNLKKELPRIPFAPDFHAYAKVGAQLMDLHINYESVEPWPLQETINRDTPYTRAVTGKMKLSKDRASLQFNEAITLHPIPAEAFHYKLGNRSALEWIIDQYQVKRDAQGAVTSDPNREDDPAYVFNLVARVIRVSLETLNLVKALPALFPQ